jgi:Domain of unknown function (DUF4440)
MKRYLPLAALLLLALASISFAQTPAASPSPSAKPKPVMSKAQIQKTLIASEKKLWEAFKNKDPKPFKTTLSADSVGVGEMGVQSKADLLKEITSGGCDIKSFSLSDFKLTTIDGNAAVLTYKGVTEGTCGGKAIPTVWSSTVYVRRSGKWWAVAHQETPAK